MHLAPRLAPRYDGGMTIDDLRTEFRTNEQGAYQKWVSILRTNSVPDSDLYELEHLMEMLEDNRLSGEEVIDSAFLEWEMAQ